MAIPNNTITTHHIGNAVAEFKAGMRAEDFPHLASILTNLYSNPIAAVIREYSTNALDSHIAAGVKRPIEVTLPTEAKREFSVQDFGVGLSVDDLRDVYSMYGRSTKRDSNAFVGQLGLGCKSGLTYADAFTITSVKGGVKVVAMSTKDERGVGVIKVLDTVASDEPNGVKITIPVERWHESRFRSEAEELFMFWEQGTVLIDGQEPEVPEWRKQALAIDPWTFVVPQGSGLRSSYVVMGNVAYEVPDVEDSKHRAMRRFVAYVNMGDVDFVPSREDVHHTPWTDETLSDLADYIRLHFRRVLDASIAGAENAWAETQAKVLWKGSQVAIRANGDRPIWTYDPNGYHRKASGSSYLTISHLVRESTAAVLGYPARTLSAPARERLTEYFPGTTHFIVFPEGATGVSQLDGRPNTAHWNDVLAATTGPTVDDKGVKIKRPKVETKYATYQGAPMTAAELAKVPGKVLYIGPGGSVSYGTFGATIVCLRSSNQEDRLRRLVPGIKTYGSEVERQRKVAEAAITADDRRWTRARGLSSAFSGLNPDAVDDPDLADTIRLCKVPESATIKAARIFNIAIGNPADQQWIKALQARYPLANQDYYYAQRLPKDEVLFYVNAKYAAAQAAAEEDSSAVA